MRPREFNDQLIPVESPIAGQNVRRWRLGRVSCLGERMICFESGDVEATVRSSEAIVGQAASTRHRPVSYQLRLSGADLLATGSAGQGDRCDECANNAVHLTRIRPI